MIRRNSTDSEYIERLEYLRGELRALLGTSVPIDGQALRAREIHKALIAVLAEWQAALTAEFGLG